MYAIRSYYVVRKAFEEFRGLLEMVSLAQVDAIRVFPPEHHLKNLVDPVNGSRDPVTEDEGIEEYAGQDEQYGGPDSPVEDEESYNFV